MEEEVDIGQKVLQSTLEEIKATGHSDPCVICLDSVSERAVTSPCHHYSFDFPCLVSWLQQNSTCPLCKTDVKIVKYRWKSPRDFKIYKVIPAARTPNSGISTSEHLYYASRRHARWRTHTSRPIPNINHDSALLQRRRIYRLQLFSLHVGSNRFSGYRDLNPQLFCRDETLISRARKWIRRELKVFEFLDPDGSEEGSSRRQPNNTEFLLQYIIAILKTVDIKGSGGQAEELLQEFLGRDITRLFLHELKAWLRSPYLSLEDWDRNVQYTQAMIKIDE